MNNKINRIYICSTNQYKIAEVSSILTPIGVELCRGPVMNIEEPYKTFKENADKKAREYSSLTFGFSLAEDSGLCVNALNGLPGVKSARFRNCTVEDRGYKIIKEDPSDLHPIKDRDQIDKDNVQYVLDLLNHHGSSDRSAYFHIALSLSNERGQIIYSCEAKVFGTIATSPRGTRGFGYDSIFIGNDTYGKTFAELDFFRKNLRSHRIKALWDLREWLVKGNLTCQ